MNKDIMLGVLIGFILTAILAGVGGFFVYQKFTTSGFPGASQSVGGSSGSASNGSSGNCALTTGETAFSGKVSTISPPDHPDDKQYTLQSADGKTYYLRTTPAQESNLQNKVGKNAQVNGTLVTPQSGDVNVTTVCP